MSTSSEQVVAALRESLKELDRLRRQNRRLRAVSQEPLAIVGMSCRYPGGASSPRALWDLLETGADAISSFPADRGWDLQALYESNPQAVQSGRSYVREGGFLHDAAEFDADFFRISPREALVMDPQQRLLLEVAWEAIEDAGLDPTSLRGSRTGVFAGVMSQDYGMGLQAYGEQAERQPYVLAGATTSVITGRVAYALGLEGAAVTIDTACSSSLVALHLACQALRAGECSLALAGGVSVLSTPGVFIEFSRQRGLAPDGRCKAFADAADGTSMSEGVGVLLLERLSDARRNEHPVLALVRGSAVNQDGASNGLTAPNGPSQRRMIRQALASAGLKASAIDAVEAHGTGTVLGDPIEAQALLATYGQDRQGRAPLWLGSMKSNIGHTQAAAGVAGVIKMVMAMRNGRLPRTLHVDRPSTKVDWDAGNVRLLTEAQPWPREGEPRRVGISSFGVSGTNAHLIVEEAPPEDGVPSARSSAGSSSSASTAEDGGVSIEQGGVVIERDGAIERDAASGNDVTDRTRIDSSEAQAAAVADGSTGQVVGQEQDDAGVLDLDVLPWVLSGRGAGALRAQSKHLRDFVNAEPNLAPADVAASLAARPVFEGRGVVIGRDRSELLDGLEGLVEEVPCSGVASGTTRASAGGIAFVFPGQGSQWTGMALELTERSTVFARCLHECGEALAPFVDWSLEDVLLTAAGASELERVDVVQPALFAVMVSLAGLWEASGVRPDAVIGHSQGEIAAACVAGSLSLENASQLIALRGRALGALAGRGGMVSLAAPLEDVRRRIEPFAGAISIAAINGPASLVVSGEVQALQELLDVCAADGVRARRIPVDYAAHSVHVEEIRDTLAEGCAGIAPRSGTVPFYSSVSSGVLDGEALDADYWYRNLRDTVNFEGATRALLDAGMRTFIEISPHPVLGVGMQETVAGAEEPDTATAVSVLGSLRRNDGGVRRVLLSLGEAWVRGAPVDWRVVLSGIASSGIASSRVKLPTYAFQRERYWLAQEDHGAPATTKPTGVENEFWEAVEAGDPGSLADELKLRDTAERSSLQLVLPALSAWRRRRQGESVTSAWRYRINWKRLGGSRGAPRGTWLVVVPSGLGKDEWVACAIGALEARGVRVARVEVEPEAMLDRDALSGCLHEALLTGRAESAAGEGRQPSSGVDGVLSLLALEEAVQEHHEAVPLGLAGTLVLTQALEDVAIWAPLWLATRGAVLVESADRLESPTQAMVWGLGRVISLEIARRRCGLLDLPAALDAGAQRSLCCVLGGGAGEEDQLAVRSSGLFARRLLRSPIGHDRSGDIWKPRGTVLITGGTGGLGAHVARWLAHAGAEHLVLASRGGSAAAGAMELEGELEGLGAEVRIAQCDVSDRDQLVELIESLPAEQPLDAVVHVAGVSGGGMLGGMDADRLQATLACKARAALHLHELTRHLNLSAFVTFSSLAATMGSATQGDYAAANAFLDALAEHRHALGLPATSVAWGLWEGAGMGDSSVSEEFQRRGILPMAPQHAIGALRQALDCDEVCMTVARIDWERYAPAYTFAKPRPLIEDLPEAREALAATQPRLQSQPVGDAFARRLSGLSARERKRVALELVRAEAAAVLGHRGVDAIEPERAFGDLGFDSVTAVEMRQRLQEATGLSIVATAVFDYPTPLLLAEHLLREVSGMSQAIAPARPSVARTQEPIAIVGMGCRYPGGASSPERLWTLLSSGIDAIAAFPTDREWDVERLYDPDPDKPGTSYVHEGGFVYDAADFDAGFFGISPREAITIDPQQRLLLETSWEAFEHAGILPAALRGTQTGVFVGMNSQDYGARSHAAGAAEGHLITGNSPSFLSGRIAYVLGLEGPAISIDTACSSALVAIHLACGALRGEECSLALAGGAAVMSTPLAFTEFSRQRGLAADGRCKSFADAADGTNWGEGVGVVLLERLSDAQRQGHEVLAVVRASAVSQDGASNGLTAPNGPSQQRVIRQALANAGLSPHEVDAVEAHGTGTRLGDPIEAQALLATYGQDRPADRPLWLGSIKSNIGHTQAAGGAAGVMKMTMALQHGLLPKTLHVDAPSSQVDWSAGSVSLLSEAHPWQKADEPRRAGISSFGISGTNVHLILEEAPPTNGERSEDELTRSAINASVDPPILAWTLSGKGSEALRAQARRLHDFIGADERLDAGDVGFSLAGRSAFENRAVVTGSARGELLEGLAAMAAGQPSANVLEGVARRHTGGTAFMFAGQGAQRAGMGRELYRAFPVFKDALDEACAELDGHLGRSLLEVMFADAGTPEAGLLDQTMFTQTALFALEVALFKLLDQWGVHPDYLIGHSIGELSAACAAQALTLGDACKLAAARGRLMGALPIPGAMLAVQASEDEVLENLDRSNVAIAAVNGPSSVVLSGDEQAITELNELWVKRDRKTHRLRVSHAFHSHHMDSMLEQLREVASELSFAEAQIPIISNLTGEELSAEQLGEPDYWVRHARHTVRFADGLRQLRAQGAESFLEVGPGGVLSAMCLDCASSASSVQGTEAFPVSSQQDTAGVQDATVAVPLLRENCPEDRAFVSALSALWVQGVAVDWTAPLASSKARRLRLPTYAFQRRRHWLEVSPTPRPEDPVSLVDSWSYRLNWQPITAPSTRKLAGAWLVVVPADFAEDPWQLALIDSLGQSGAEVLSFACAEGTVSREQLVASLREMVREFPEPQPRGVISLLALQEQRDPARPSVPKGLADTLALVQALGDASVQAPLWLLTQGAMAVTSAETLANPVQAQVWGLSAAAALELPERWGGIVDLAESPTPETWPVLASVLAGGHAEDRLAVRGGTVFVQRLARRTRGEAAKGSWKPPSGTILITGGTGGLGAHVARWLAREKAEHLLLISRGGPDAPGAAELRTELEEAGAEVTIAACDVADRQQLASSIDSLPADRPLTGVVHVAGVSVTGTIDSAEVGDLELALSAKARGAENLDSLTANLDLAEFVLFSSVASTFGSGQGAYAAANAYLDALAAQRRARGLAGTSVAWGAWEGEGMAARDGLAEIMRMHGLVPMAPELALEALGQSLLREETSIAVVDMHWEAYVAAFGGTRSLPLIEGLPKVRGALGKGAGAGDESAARELRERLRDASPEERRQLLVELVRSEVSVVLGHTAQETFDARQAFKELGFDSLMAVELRKRLTLATGLALPAALVFNHPTPAALADYLLERLSEQALAAGPPAHRELEQLELAIADSSMDDGERTAVQTRLHALIAQLNEAARSQSETTVAQEIESASADEVIDFIEQQFGVL